MIIVDAGACIGETIEHWFKYNKPDIVYAFEPVSNNFQELQKKYGNNPQVILEKYALSNFIGTAPIYISTELQWQDRLGGTLKADKYRKKEINRVLEQVRVIKLSDYWKEHIKQSVDILKMNVEGAEFDILEDLLDTCVIHQFAHITFEDHSIRPKREIQSIQEKAQVITKRLKEEYKGEITLMSTGHLSFDKPYFL